MQQTYILQVTAEEAHSSYLASNLLVPIAWGKLKVTASAEHLISLQVIQIIALTSIALHTRSKNHFHHQEDVMSFPDSAFISSVMSFQSSVVVHIVLVWN